MNQTRKTEYVYISEKGFISNRWDTKKEAMWRGKQYSEKMGEKVQVEGVTI